MRPTPSSRGPLLRVALLIATFVLTGACDGGDRTADTADQSTVVDSAGITITTINTPPDRLPQWQLDSQPLWTITGTGTDDSTSLSLVGPVRWLSDGGLVVADTDGAQLLVFDSLGTLQRSHGRRGSGPAEFQEITNLSVGRGDTISTFDMRLRRLSFWHAGAGFVRLLSLSEGGDDDVWPAGAWLWQDSLVVVLQLGSTPFPAPEGSATVARWPETAELTLRDSGGRLLNRSPRFDGSFGGADSRSSFWAPFSPRPFVAVASDRLYFGSGSKFHVSTLGASFALEREVRWPLQQEPVQAEEIARLRENFVAFASRFADRERAGQVFDQSVHPSLLPKYRPAIDRALIDDTQRLWLARFEPPRVGTPLQVPPNRWTVHAVSGEPIAAVQLPPLTRLEAVRGNRAAVVQRDSLDIEFVAVYRMAERSAP